MPAKRDVIVNPFVSEFVYDNIVNSTHDQRKFLNGKYTRVGRHSRPAKAFSVKATQEEKALMLSKLGIPFAWFFNIDLAKFKELFENRAEFTNAQLTDKMLKENWFVVSDKQFMTFAGLMASNCHSETYMINRDFNKIGFRAKEWRKEYANTSLTEAKESLTASRDIARLMTNTIMFSKYTDGEFGINEAEIAVLMYMYSKSKEFIELNELKRQFNGIYRNFKLVAALKVLRNAKYIEEGEAEWAKQYRMTGWGVDIALRFEKKVFSLENY